MKNIFSTLFFLIITFTFGQKSNYPYATIPAALLENANSVIRYQQIDINITSQSLMTIKKQKVVTVLNKYGNNNVDAIEHYDKKNRIKAIEATILDESGNEIKRIRKKDFRDESEADGVSIFNDDRQIYLDYIPVNYPYTVIFESELETTNTAFIPSWYPIDDTYESIEKSIININFSDDVGFKYLENNFQGSQIEKKEGNGFITFSTSNIQPIENEDYSPSYKKIIPFVLFGVDNVSLEGVSGTIKTWNDFGSWIYSNLLKDTEELSKETEDKIKFLVKEESDPIKKAKIIYKYVQDKTRYVSIQLGIGGWKPMLAKDVDRLGYGDCKALSNYTRVLLKSVGIESYYTIIYGDENKINLQKDFVAMQGNHVILSIPVKDKLLFLECTSQTSPFNFNGNFTDDRYALIIKPSGGEIIKTNEYSEIDNSQIIKGKYSINEEGLINGELKIKSKGIQYNNIYSIEKQSKEEIDEHYKQNLAWINNLVLNKVKFINNKEDIEFMEELNISGKNYATNASSNSLMFPINAFNQNHTIPKRYRNRKNPIEITRGFRDEDLVEVTIPSGYLVSAKPVDIEINEKFGTYKINIETVNQSTLIYKRTIEIKKGFYDKSEYDNYRKFREQIAKNDNSKIIIQKP
jgi:hypothetical protein